MDRAALTSRPVILVAEDDADIRDLLTDLLDDAGYRVVAAVDGLAALDAARSCEPDIILVDAGMPRLDGAGFCRAYRDDGGTAAVVLISAAADDVIAATTEACGAAASIPKPFEIEQILETVARVLDGR
jgi:two-component system chemotaxis response regulator CheY